MWGREPDKVSPSNNIKESFFQTCWIKLQADYPDLRGLCLTTEMLVANIAPKKEEGKKDEEKINIL